MTIYFDLSAAVHHRAGLGRYGESLARGLFELIPEELGVFFNQESGVAPIADLATLPTRTVRLGYKPWRMAVLLGQAAHVGFNRLVPDARLFHATEHLLLPLRGVPTVLTVHDLIFRHLPQHHKRLNRWYLNLALPLFCRRATHIISVTEHSRQDVIRSYHIPPEKVSVVYEAADPRLQPASPEAMTAARARYHLPDDYLLYVGTLEPRKNLVRLLEAWTPLYSAGEAPPLVIAGKRGWLYDDLFAAVERSPVRSAVLTPGYIAEEDLGALYTGATAFTLPSIYEGFGLPVLEAMACGTPVLCSSGSSFPEVAGDAAVMVDPHDVEAIREGLRSLLRDRELRESYRERGFRQAARFSWRRAAEETLAIYRRVMQ